MGESVHAKIGQFLDYGKLSAIHPLKMPKINKQDIPSYIYCPRYEKAKNSLEQKSELYRSKVDRCNVAIQELEQTIEAMKRKHSSLDPGSGFWLDKTDAQAVARYNDRIYQMRRMTDKIQNAIEKHNDLIDKRAEVIEEAKEKLQELTSEAMLVIDDDIVEVLDRCAQIVNKLAGSQIPDDLVSAIDICLIEMRIFALFEDLIEGNAQRKDVRAHITEVNEIFAKLCANENLMNYLVDMYRRNQNLIQKNADICQQAIQALASVDQGRLTNLTQSVDAALTEKINTSFEYKDIVDPAQLDKVIVQIKQTITALNQNIVKANEAVTAASDFAKIGVSADQQAKTLLSSMKSNVEAMKNDIISQGHFTIQLIDEAVIEDFYHKDVRPAATVLRKHLVGAIGEGEINNLVKNGKDRFSLEKVESAIKQANLVRLQVASDKVPAHIKNTTALIKSAESDIQKAGEVPKQNADALNAELGSKYIQACLPIIGLFAAIRILGRLKTFEPAFRSTNQIYQDLANDLLAKNSKMTNIIAVIGGSLGLGGIAVFFILKNEIADSVTVYLGLPGTVLVLYVITVLLLTTVGKRLRSYLTST